MDAAVDTALRELRGSLVTKLQAVLEQELAARLASLEDRERKLEARSVELIAQALAFKKEPVPQQPAAGPGIFVPRIPIESLRKPAVPVSVPQLGLATRASLFKPRQTLQQSNREQSPTNAGPGTGLAPQAVPTCKLPMEPVTMQSCSMPPGGADSFSVASSLAASARYELNAAVTGNNLHVPSPVSTTASGAQTHRVERILTAPYQVPPSPSPLTYQRWASNQRTPTESPVATPSQTPRRSPCHTPNSRIRDLEPRPAYRRTSSAPARVMRLSEWNFLVPKGSVGPQRAEFDGGQMFRVLDSNHDGFISPQEVEEYIVGRRQSSRTQAARPPIRSPRQSASPRASLHSAALPALPQSPHTANRAGATPVYDPRRSLISRSYTPSPVASKANSRSTVGGWSPGGVSREQSRRNESRDRDKEGCSAAFR